MKQSELKSAVKQISETKSRTDLEKIRLHYLGRKGVITKALKQISKLSDSQRKKIGKELNEAKSAILLALNNRRSELLNEKIADEAAKPIDITAPARGRQYGHFHPVKELEKELVQIFWQLGFQVAEGPEIETDWYNFEALNIKADHPARDMQDTFYLENGGIPRTHTSSVQIRYMENNQPPIRIISPGKTYRNENEDQTHIWAFHQIEGLVVDKGITLADLKGTLEFMMKSLFGDEAEIKLLPSFFPYTEPSLEVHARTRKDAPWLEMAGAGMVHPQVLLNVGIDPKVYTGFAFGAGLERLAAIRHGVDDIRYFWRPDLRFLKQF